MPIPVPPRTEEYDFPSFDSTVISSYGFLDIDEVGYFWSVRRGDMVAETFATGLDCICEVMLDVHVVRNVLHWEPVKWSLEINGRTVASFQVPRNFLGPISVSKVLQAPILGPIYTVDLKVENQIASGQGSHTLAFAGEYDHQISLTGCAMPPPIRPSWPFLEDAESVDVFPAPPAASIATPESTPAPLESSVSGLGSTEVDMDSVETDNVERDGVKDTPLNLAPTQTLSGGDSTIGATIGCVVGATALLVGSLWIVYTRRRLYGSGTSVLSDDTSIVVFS